MNTNTRYNQETLQTQHNNIGLNVNSNSHSSTSVSKRGGFSFGLFRIFQFASSAVTMGLSAYGLRGYHRYGYPKNNLGLATSSISTFYLIALFILLAVMAGSIWVGALFIVEALLCLLWLATFIVLAKVHGSHSCKAQFVDAYTPKYGSPAAYDAFKGQFNPYTNTYGDNSFKRPCRTSKASIAFSGLTFLLFALSTFLMWRRVVRPLVSRFGRGALFTSAKRNGVSLCKWSALGFNDNERSTNDKETGWDAHDKHTVGASTSNGSNQENGIIHSHNGQDLSQCVECANADRTTQGAVQNADTAVETVNRVGTDVSNGAEEVSKTAASNF